MREVAEAAQVALGTLYRYFPSKVHLLVAVMAGQLGQLKEQVRRHPPTAGEPAGRVAETQWKKSTPVEVTAATRARRLPHEFLMGQTF